MMTVDTKKNQRRAYGATSFVSHAIQGDLQLLASDSQVALITTLRKSGTAVSVGSATTYQTLDAVNARLYIRAMYDGTMGLIRWIPSLKHHPCFFQRPDEPLRRMPAR